MAGCQLSEVLDALLPLLATLTLSTRTACSGERSGKEAGMTTERIIGDAALIAVVGFMLAIIAGVFG